MPGWIQWVTYLIPLRYFLVIVRGIVLKGVGISRAVAALRALLACGLVPIALGDVEVEQAVGDGRHSRRFCY